MGSHRALGRLKGSLGGWVLNRAFDATGAEALSPPVDQQGFATFLYEELTWPHVTFQFGGRVDHTSYEPNGEPNRSFTTGSGSLGLLVRPAAADDRLTIAFSAARAARSPALEELFYFGPHPGNFAFEVGNPDLDPEHALGFDLSLRWRTSRVTGEVTYFRNDVNDYLFRAPLTEEEFNARLDEFAARFPSRDIEGPDGEDEEGFPIVEYIAADSVLQGIEAHSDVQITPQIARGARTRLRARNAQGRGRAAAANSAASIPRRICATSATHSRREAMYRSSRLRIACSQPRRRRTDTSWDGRTRAYSFGQGAVAHTLTARLENVTNELYRNHLSLIKDLVPEMGRNFQAAL